MKKAPALVLLSFLLACGRQNVSGLNQPDLADLGAEDVSIPDKDAAPRDADPGDFPVADISPTDADPGDLPAFDLPAPDTGMDPGDVGPRDLVIIDGGEQTDLGEAPDLGEPTDSGPADTGPPDSGAMMCTIDDDCRGLDRCDPSTNTCVRCFNDTHCPGASVCDPTGTPTCRIPCRPNGGCFGGDVCDPQVGACVECLGDADCSNGQVCNQSSRTCVQCAQNVDCALSPGQPICDVAQMECVGCTQDPDCAMGEVCTIQSVCAPATGRGPCDPCTVDDDCGGPADLCVGLSITGGFVDRGCAPDCAGAPNSCPSGFECTTVNNGAMVCRPSYDMNRPTCRALRNVGVACAFSNQNGDQGCGLELAQDAACVATSTSTGVCTVWCQDNADCPSGTTCQALGGRTVCL